MPQIILGLTIFFVSMIPVGSFLFRKFVGGMYSPMFKEYPHYVFLSLNLIATYVIPLIVTLLFIKYFNVKDRLPRPYPSKWLFSIDAFFILLPQLLRLWTSTIEGGGASFVLMSYAAPFIVAAKALIVIGAIKLFMAMKPSEKYSYPESSQ